MKSLQLFTIAHHTQFYSPGWSYLQHGRGLGQLAGNGSFVSLTDPRRSQLTIVIETMVWSIYFVAFGFPLTKTPGLFGLPSLTLAL